MNTTPMKTAIRSVSIILVLSGCSLIEEGEKIIFPNNVEKTIKEEKTISISCNKGDINDFQAKGWRIKDSTEREVTCTWKTKRSRPGCNLDKDKGCRIRYPDKKGTETTYVLERTKKLE